MYWCSFCSSEPAQGILTVRDESDEIIELPACNKCAAEQIGGSLWPEKPQE